jgi:hypothetical protein
VLLSFSHHVATLLFVPHYYSPLHTALLFSFSHHIVVVLFVLLLSFSRAAILLFVLLLSSLPYCFPL